FPARALAKGSFMATVTDRSAFDRWEKENAQAPKRPQPPTTVSGVPIDALYTPESLNGFDPETDLGYPGQYPFTRGVHASMYRSRLWTCASSPASARQGRPTSASSSSSPAGRTA